MSDNVVIVLSCGTDNPNRATRGLFLAMTAHQQGKNTCVFLLDEAVYLARRGITDHLQAATGDSAADHLVYLQEFEVPILVCTPCAVTRRITEAELVEGSRMATGAELIGLTDNATVISL